MRTSKGLPNDPYAQFRFQRAPVLSCALVFLATLSALSTRPVQAAEVYTFESLQMNNKIHGQDLWKDQPGQGDAGISLDDTGNGTKVVRHLTTVAFNQSAFITRTNDATFNFLPFSGAENNAVIQFEANGEHIALFALGCDINGDGLLLSTDGELGPAFGVADRNFRIQEANLGPVYDDAFGQGNSGNDWYRIQLNINFSANDGDGSGSLYYMNLTDHDTTFQAAPGLLNKPLGLGSLHSSARPPRWNAMWLHLLTSGGSIPRADNLVPNLKTIRITQITLSAGNVAIQWRGGIGPYQLQRREDLDNGTWMTEGPSTLLTNTTATLLDRDGFFRITQP